MWLGAASCCARGLCISAHASHCRPIGRPLLAASTAMAHGAACELHRPMTCLVPRHTHVRAQRAGTGLACMRVYVCVCGGGRSCTHEGGCRLLCPGMTCVKCCNCYGTFTPGLSHVVHNSDRRPTVMCVRRRPRARNLPTPPHARPGRRPGPLTCKNAFASSSSSMTSGTSATKRVGCTGSMAGPAAAPLPHHAWPDDQARGRWLCRHAAGGGHALPGALRCMLSCAVHRGGLPVSTRLCATVSGGGGRRKPALQRPLWLRVRVCRSCGLRGPAISAAGRTEDSEGCGWGGATRPRLLPSRRALR